MSKAPEKRQLPFRKENYKIMIIGIVIVALGYILMMGGAAEDPKEFSGDELFNFQRNFLAPFTVLAGYVIVLVGIMKKPKE